jgi:hypothetical protein
MDHFLEPKLKQTYYKDGGCSFVRDSKSHNLACNINGVAVPIVKILLH